jgi:hypothetical protein
MPIVIVAVSMLFAFASATAAQERYPDLGKEPACQTLVPTAAGGPRPQNPDVVVLRFLGVANYELAYRDNVILLDAGIDTLSWWEQSGVTPEMMTKDVDAILIGHAHGEHLWDASEAEAKEAETVRGRGSRDPSIATMGVINYLFTLGNNFRVMFADSPGPITVEQRALMQRVSAVDVAMLPYVNFEAGIPPLVELVKTFKPGTVFLGHHDGPGTMLWSSNYPPAYAIRSASPNTRTLDVLYRTPVCFNTATKDMVIGW